jgi:hypothetical protein
VETCRFKQTLDIDCIVQKPHDRDEEQRVEDQVDFSFFLLFFSAVVLFELCCAVEVKVLGIFLDFLREVLKIVELAGVGFFEDVVSFLDEEEVFVVVGEGIVGMILFGEGKEVGLDLFISGVGLEVEGLVVVEEAGGVEDGVEGGEFVEDHLKCYKEV